MDNTTNEGKKKSFVYKLNYGDENGKFQKIGEVRDLIPQFRDFYYKTKLDRGMKYSSIKIMREFQEKIAPLLFYPYPTQYRSWRLKWDVEIKEETDYKEKKRRKELEIMGAKRKRDEETDLLIVPDEEELEGGMKTLAGSLLDDASNMLWEDQNENKYKYSSDELIRRRSYILNVMGHITKLVHGKEALRLKKSANQRENAGFLMNLLNQASSGKITDETIQVLKSSITK